MTPNGRYIMLNDLEYEEKIRRMNDRELLEFTTRQIYDIYTITEDNRKRIEALERIDKKAFSIVSGLGAFAGAAIAVIVDFFVGK